MFFHRNREVNNIVIVIVEEHIYLKHHKGNVRMYLMVLAVFKKAGDLFLVCVFMFTALDLRYMIPLYLSKLLQV